MHRLSRPTKGKWIYCDSPNDTESELINKAVDQKTKFTILSTLCNINTKMDVKTRYYNSKKPIDRTYTSLDFSIYKIHWNE